MTETYGVCGNMKTLMISDIHANEPALDAVLEDAGNYDRLVFLGDLANFGPHPSECVEKLKSLNPVCIIGNHDEQIVSETPENFWDKWSKTKLSQEQQGWIAGFHESLVLDGHILLIHGSYSVKYDILPNTPDEDIVEAFKNLVTLEIDQVWFGHYHYQIDRLIGGVEYHCIRPVGHHRDKDTRASYSVYEDGKITHKRVPYNLNKTIEDFKKSDAFEDMKLKEQFVAFLENAYEEDLLKKDIKQMKLNEQKAVKN